MWLLRDEWGDLIVAASFWYGTESNMGAEFKALLDGLSLIDRTAWFGYGICIESDSLVLVRTVKGWMGCAWHLLSFLEQIQSFLGRMQFTLDHVYREANCVADALANKAVQDDYSSEFYVRDQLPGTVRLRLLQDLRSLLVLRTKSSMVYDEKG